MGNGFPLKGNGSDRVSKPLLTLSLLSPNMGVREGSVVTERAWRRWTQEQRKLHQVVSRNTGPTPA